MEPFLVLPAIMLVWSVAFLAQVVPASRRLGGGAGAWVVKAALALVAVGVGVALESEPVVYAAATAWALLLVAPSFAANAHARALSAQDYDKARRLAGLVRLAHPFGGWRREPGLMAALARARAGEDAAIGDMRRMLAEPGLLPASRACAMAELARLTGDWGSVVSGPTPPGGDSVRLRALGEQGRLSELVEAYRHAPVDPASDLMLLAFGGRPDGVAALLDAAPFAALTPNARRFWLATATLVRDPSNREARDAVVAGAEGPQREALIARRLGAGLAGGLASPQALSPDRRGVIDHVARAVLEAKAQGRLPAVEPPAPRPVVTLALIAANVAVFGLELWTGGWGGPTDLETLYELGALWPPAVLQGGEWSRLFTALFLHYGGMHLALNMLGLLAFGRMVEARAGRLGMIAIYAVSGLGSMAGVLALEAALGAEPTLLVGASGAIFGVVGAFGGLLLRDAARGAPGARRGLTMIAGILVAQAAFDLIVPQVSFSAHAFGFVIGAAVGLLLGGRKRR